MQYAYAHQFHFKRKMKKMSIKAKRFIMYALRWQLSTPVYACVLYCVNDKYGYTTKTIIANFIGACIFYWIDRFIFTKRHH